MKFQIFKTSSFNEEKCPCKNSIKENEDFFVNINTLEQLLELKESLKKDFSRSQVGKTLDWLPEEMVGDYTVGYTENYLRVYVKGDYTNKGIIKVKVIEPYLDGAIGKIL